MKRTWILMMMFAISSAQAATIENRKTGEQINVRCIDVSEAEACPKIEFTISGRKSVTVLQDEYISSLQNAVEKTFPAGKYDSLRRCRNGQRATDINSSGESVCPRQSLFAFSQEMYDGHSEGAMGWIYPPFMIVSHLVELTFIVPIQAMRLAAANADARRDDRLVLYAERLSKRLRKAIAKDRNIKISSVNYSNLVLIISAMGSP